MRADHSARQIISVPLMDDQAQHSAFSVVPYFYKDRAYLCLHSTLDADLTPAVMDCYYSCGYSLISVYVKELIKWIGSNIYNAYVTPYQSATERQNDYKKVCIDLIKQGKYRLFKYTQLRLFSIWRNHLLRTHHLIKLLCRDQIHFYRNLF